MRLSCHPLGVLAGLVLFAFATAAPAADPPDPLRLVPDQADLFVKVEQPRTLIESVTGLDVFKQLQTLDVYNEFLDSTNYRRFTQLVAYFERQLGARWPDALDRLAGGGAVLAVKFGDPAPVLLVVQGKDEALVQKFAKLGLEVIEQELARQEVKESFTKCAHRQIDTYRIGKDFHGAVAGAALLLSNSEKGLHAALDQHLDGGKESLAGAPAVAEARKLLPPEPLAWGWLNLEAVRRLPQVGEVFKRPSDLAIFTWLPFGGQLDVAARSPFLCAGLYREKDGFALRFRLPRGRDGMAPELAMHVPLGAPLGSRPLLEPKGVIYSHSFYLDLAAFWEHKGKYLNEQQVKDLEEFDKNSGRFLAGARLSQLFAQAGAYHRLVVAAQSKPGYKTAPKIALPAFAYVVEMREPDAFAKSMDTVLRGAALLVGTPFKLKLVEEKHGGRTIVGYRFPEDVPLKQDENDLRFNFSPCFVRVGDQFLISSTTELAHELIDLLEKEAEGGKKGSASSGRIRVYAEGGVQLLKAFEDQLVTQAVLGQAIPVEEARKQVQALADLVRQLGVLQVESHYGAKEYRFDLRLKMGK